MTLRGETLTRDIGDVYDNKNRANKAIPTPEEEYAIKREKNLDAAASHRNRLLELINRSKVTL